MVRVKKKTNGLMFSNQMRSRPKAQTITLSSQTATGLRDIKSLFSPKKRQKQSGGGGVDAHWGWLPCKDMRSCWVCRLMSAKRILPSFGLQAGKGVNLTTFESRKHCWWIQSMSVFLHIAWKSIRIRKRYSSLWYLCWRSCLVVAEWLPKLASWGAA